jgi:hypothetical protein
MQCCLLLIFFQGSDRISFTVQDEDEIHKFQSGRYFSASEAWWRLFEFPLHERDPAVTKLALHLPGEENMVFEDPEEGIQAAADGPPVTTLTAYFEAMSHFDDAGDLLYCDFPSYFVFGKGAGGRKRWNPRQRGNRNVPQDERGRIRRLVIGRMPAITTAAAQRELFSLRTLLLYKPAKSFEDLRTIDGVVYDTFHEAAAAIGVGENDREQVRLKLLPVGLP